MKAALQFFLILVAVMLVSSASMAQTVTTTLGQLEGVKTGQEKEFTVTVDAAGQTATVRGRLAFTDYQKDQIGQIQYKAPGEEAYMNLSIANDGIIMFGPENGFALANGVHSFKIRFNAGRTYPYTIALVNTANGQNVVTTSGSVVVQQTAEPTIDGTLDIISDVTADKDILWQVLVRPNDRADNGDMVNLVIKLQNPEQRNNFTLMYNANREAQTEEEAQYSTVTFDETGMAVIGPEGGEEMKGDYKYYFKINFAAAGTYNYALNLHRVDGNVLASVNETVMVATVAGLDDMIGDTRVAVYPTVSDGMVRLNLGKIRNANVAVVDILGRQVLELNRANGVVEINTKKFAKGTYFVKVFAGNDVASSRLIVK
ncbi:T9SS type A sorting domain-containing protein [Pontibacter oryzae]|uniref:T9SS C-terminal target domain-containing protein n=1 Tax=Pontibacter oryzae TaxID=2304593 RepID=A0A399S2I6_9BACT|nr:T9SS type A sorting domain-containing protein [Pontibacter oryzae]RIJ36649.1 T9SS C-terminal target domain-containing protein [Pontibacter oryzae]